MAPTFFSKFVRAASPSNNDSATTATTETKATKRHSRDRSGSNKSTKSGKSRQPSDDSHHTSSYSPRTSFQFGISTLGKNRSASTPSAPKIDTTTNGTSSRSSSTSHRNAEGLGAQVVPPVPPLPETLKVGETTSKSKSRRNSIISAFGGAKNKDNSIVRPPPPTSTDSTSTAKAIPVSRTSSGDQSDDIPVVVVAGQSRESFDTNASSLGVTVIPPSPLLYTPSLAETQSDSLDIEVQNFTEEPANNNDEEKQVEQPPVSVEPTPITPIPDITSPTTATTTTENAGSYVLGTLFGRRARTASISSAISGFIGSRPEIPAFVKNIVVDGSADDSAIPTPDTAATIKPSPFNLEDHEDIPPVPNSSDDMARSATQQQPNSNATLAPGHEVQRKTSTRSLINIPAPLNLTESNTLPSRPAPIGNHTRSVTSPPDAFTQNEVPYPGATTMSPIVESPTAMQAPEYPNVIAGSNTGKPAVGTSAQQPSATNGSTNGNSSGSANFISLLSPRKVDDDAASIISTSSKLSPEKKRPWKRSTTRKPTGLASAIAASGLAMANPGVSPVYAAATSAPILNVTSSSTSSGGKNKDSASGLPYLSKSPTRSTLSTGKSTKSPNSAKSTGRGSKSPSASRHTLHSAGNRNRHRRPSASAFSDGASSHGGNLSTAGLSEYYSGDSDGGLSRRSSRGRRRTDSGSESDTEDSDSDSEDDSSEDDDILEGLDLGDDDIPVTGFAVASNKRNADFHELFPTIPEGDYLIEDYGCALQREILIQGRLYISENHVCFHANIFGWITDLSIPISEIISLEKKMTAFVIPNAIQITTRQAKYSFASFLSRDTTFDVIYNIWRVSRPDDIQSIRSGRGSLEGANAGSANGHGTGTGSAGAMNGNVEGAVGAGGKQAVRKATQCTCGREGKHYTETALEAVFPGTPEKINNLIFASGFIKDFLVVNQKLIDIQMSDWMPVDPGSKLLTRNMSYIKPLNASMGPKQTKCEIKDEIEHIDFDQYVSTITSTRTPDVPSGGVFTVKTRTCIMWASAISSKVVVTTQVDWTGRSFIKGIIERSAIDGQKVFHADLERAMRSYIHEHSSEFIPEGMDTSVLEAQVLVPEEVEAAAEADGQAGTTARGVSEEERNKQRERERNRRAFQWAWDTAEGAFDVAKRSAKGALDLIGDAWDQSSSTTILYFVIVILVISNLWTLVRMGKKEEIGRRKEMMKAEERERWVQSVVMTLWEELASGKKDPLALRASLGEATEGPVRPKMEQLPVETSVVLPATATDGVVAQSTVVQVLSWQEELVQLQETLARVEERVRTIKASIAELENTNLDQLD